MADAPALSAPTVLTSSHQLDDFDCGEPALNEWLTRRALANQLAGATRTYVVAAGTKVVGYYGLSAGAVAHVDAPRKTKRNMPDPVPVVLLGRLAVDRAWHGRGVGAGLLRDAVLRVRQAAEVVGIRAILVHALHEPAARFYEKFGFRRSPVRPLTLMVALDEITMEPGTA